MKRVIVVLFSVFLALMSYAQVPYFAGTVGDNKLYGYSSLKFRPGNNAQETYTTFQYGIGNSLATGIDLYSDIYSTYTGLLLRYGKKINSYYNVGGQFTPSFSLNDNMRFEYATAGLYMNGNITKSGSLFWCSNTWWGINRKSDNSLSQWTYLGYGFSLKQGRSLTPMMGEIHSWKFDQSVDMAVGCYYSIKTWNIYLWGNDLFSSSPRVVIGVDFIL